MFPHADLQSQNRTAARVSRNTIKNPSVENIIRYTDSTLLNCSLKFFNGLGSMIFVNNTHKTVTNCTHSHGLRMFSNPRTFFDAKMTVRNQSRALYSGCLDFPERKDWKRERIASGAFIVLVNLGMVRSSPSSAATFTRAFRCRRFVFVSVVDDIFSVVLNAKSAMKVRIIFNNIFNNNVLRATMLLLQ